MWSRDPHQPITAHLASLAAGEARGHEAHQHEAAVTLPHHQRAAAVPLHRHTISISTLNTISAWSPPCRSPCRRPCSLRTSSQGRAAP